MDGKIIQAVGYRFQIFLVSFIGLGFATYRLCFSVSFFVLRR